jgi:RHS repeat-associated protein
VTGFLYDGPQAIAELRGGAIDTVYHNGLAIDEVLARYGGSSGNKTLLTDALMSVIAQANDAQNADNFYAYSAYGEVTVLGPDGGNSLQYTGRENDGLGLYYYRARYYDPALKRFINEDPIGTMGGANFYTYVGGNPVSLTDPMGLSSEADPLEPPVQVCEAPKLPKLPMCKGTVGQAKCKCEYDWEAGLCMANPKCLQKAKRTLESCILEEGEKGV